MTRRVRYLIDTPTATLGGDSYLPGRKGDMGAEAWVPEEELTDDAAVDRVARAICRENCAFYGEPPCWHEDAEWPNPDCDEPGCHALAVAALADLPPPPGGDDEGEG